MPGQYHISEVRVHLICLTRILLRQGGSFCTNFSTFYQLCDLFMGNKYDLKYYFIYIFVNCSIKVHHPFGFMAAVYDVAPTVRGLRGSGL